MHVTRHGRSMDGRSTEDYGIVEFKLHRKENTPRMLLVSRSTVHGYATQGRLPRIINALTDRDAELIGIGIDLCNLRPLSRSSQSNSGSSQLPSHP